MAVARCRARRGLYTVKGAWDVTGFALRGELIAWPLAVLISLSLASLGWHGKRRLPWLSADVFNVGSADHIARSGIREVGQYVGSGVPNEFKRFTAILVKDVEILKVAVYEVLPIEARHWEVCSDRSC